MVLAIPSSRAERQNLYHAYLSTAKGNLPTSSISDAECDALETGVRAWSPAGSAAWALWGIVSARAQVEAVEGGDEGFVPEFEYLLYAEERVKMFRREIMELGVIVD
jgi:choline kinase